MVVKILFIKPNLENMFLGKSINCILIAFLFYSASCSPNRSKKEKDTLTINKNDKIHTIRITKNDSITEVIQLDSQLNFVFIAEVNNGVISGPALNFYPNGQVSKKVDTKFGVRDGHVQYYYESGALKIDLFYYFGRPIIYGAEYYDGRYGITKYSIRFGDKKGIVKIKIFDSLGNFLRDSIPPENTEYPKPDDF
jgi:antitoxin component YwqK of YwqJK toxin-antitoxin module